MPDGSQLIAPRSQATHRKRSPDFALPRRVAWLLRLAGLIVFPAPSSFAPALFMAEDPWQRSVQHRLGQGHRGAFDAALRRGGGYLPVFYLPHLSISVIVAGGSIFLALGGAYVSRQLGLAVEVAGLVVCRQRPATAKGFVFLVLEDEFDLVNVVVNRTSTSRSVPLCERSPSSSSAKSCNDGMGL